MNSSAKRRLLVVDGTPLDDISLLDGQSEHTVAVMKDGELAINRLG